MPSRTQSPLPKKFGEHCASLHEQKGIIQSQFEFAHTFNVYTLTNVLIECFNQIASPISLPYKPIIQNGVDYYLDSRGYGLQSYREGEGGVRGDAYRDYVTLMLPNNVMISSDITEDSYQPEIVCTLIGVDKDEVDKAREVLNKMMERIVKKKDLE